jgi:preprotein translocase subunit SecG
MDFSSHNGWLLGYIIGTVVVLVVVALVVPILLLAHKIGKQASRINSGLEEAVVNTSGLKGLNTTIEYATSVITGLTRGRKRLGG